MTGKLTPMPFPAPSVEGVPDNHEQMREEIDNPSEMPIPELQIGLAAYTAFMRMSTVEIPEEAFGQLQAQMMETCTKLYAGLEPVPLPPSVVAERLAAGQTDQGVYTPYIFTVAMAVLSTLVANLLPTKSHADRYAYMSEIVRCWAAFGILQSAMDNGLTAEESQQLLGSRALKEPLPIGLLASAYLQRESARKESEERGMSIEEVVNERIASIKKPVLGEPED